MSSSNIESASSPNGEADGTNANLSPRKRIRSQPPDVIVAVGSGASAQEFHCYKVTLSFASDYFDAMFSAGMKEDETSRIEFPDKDPKEWEQFYDFIDPAKIGLLVNGAKINEENIKALLPWFHEFHMEIHLKECDDFLSDIFINEDKSQITDEAKRKSFFKEKIHFLQYACKYDLSKTHHCVGEWVADYMKKYTSSDLFDQSVIKSLIPMITPLELSESGLVSNGKCKSLWHSFEQVLAPHAESIPIEVLNGDIDVFSLLVHSYTQQKMMKDMADSYEKEVLDMTKKLVRMRRSTDSQVKAMMVGANKVINTLVEKVPEQFVKGSCSESDDRLLKQIISKQCIQLKPAFELLGVQAPNEWS